MSTDVLRFDDSPFNIVDDADATQEDQQLHIELRQLIAEQLGEFDFGEENNEHTSSSLSNNPNDSNIDGDANMEDLASILAAGKLSLLEKAIQSFGNENSKRLSDPFTIDCSSAADVSDVPDASSCLPSELMGIIESTNLATISTRHETLSPTHNTQQPPTPVTGRGPYSGNLVIPYLPDELSENHGLMSSNALSPVMDSKVHPYFLTVPSTPTQPETSDLTNQITFAADQHDRQAAPNLGTNCLDVRDTRPSTIYPVINTEMAVDNHRELLYAARGHQVQELAMQLKELHEDLAKEQRIATHRLTLAEAERQCLASKVTSADSVIEGLRREVDECLNQMTGLRSQLAVSKRSNTELTQELINLRSTNESLSTQLVELTTGDAARRSAEREDRLTESLERRYALRDEEVSSQLQTVQRKLTEKDRELTDVLHQLEACKSQISTTRESYQDTLSRTTRQLEEAQEHCQKLASSALCSEVTQLRQKVREFETGRTISEDVNKILQEELQDLRDQVAVYEKALNLNRSIAAMDGDVRGSDFDGIAQYNQNAKFPTAMNDEPRRPKSVDPSVTFGDGEAGCTTQSSCNIRPASAFEHLANHETEEAEPAKKDEFLSHSVLDLKFSTRRRTVLDPNSQYFRSATRHGALTSTPAGSTVLERLRGELALCMLQYKGKQEQVTKLHEVVYMTRCQLHQAVESCKSTETNINALQNRVLTLERELAEARQLTDGPGLRENVMQGQLERLKTDYSNQEEELRSTRCRLQAVLGSEARALENEKAAAERLAASVAERDAAVDRARAVCEAHYTAMRRRLEMSWASEREAAVAQADEQIVHLRQQCQDREVEVQRATQLCQEARMATDEAVKNALSEAMQEREAERMRFWRQELPQQLATARAAWDIEWNKRLVTAINETQRECFEEYTLENRPPDSACVETQTAFPSTLCDIGVSTKAITLVTQATETEMGHILSQCGLVPSDGESPSDCAASSSPRHSNESITLEHILQVFGDKQTQCLRVQLLESPIVGLDLLEKELGSWIMHQREHQERHTWDAVGETIGNLMDAHKLTMLLPSSESLVPCPEVPIMSAGQSSSQSGQFASLVVTDQRISEKTDTVASRQPTTEALTNQKRQSDSSTPDWTRTSVISYLDRLIHALAQLSSHTQYPDQFDPSDLVGTKVGESNTPSLQPRASMASSKEVYRSAMGSIKQDVLQYVQTCQTRAAKTLHMELSRVHRRACHQYTARLRRALHEAGASKQPLSSPHWVPPSTQYQSSLQQRRRLGASLGPQRGSASGGTENPLSPRMTSSSEQQRRVSSDRVTDERPSVNVVRSLPADLESLLHVIDDVCAMTEANFHSSLSPGSTALFQAPPDVAASHSRRSRRRNSSSQPSLSPSRQPLPLRTDLQSGKSEETMLRRTLNRHSRTPTTAGSISTHADAHEGNEALSSVFELSPKMEEEEESTPVVCTIALPTESNQADCNATMFTGYPSIVPAISLSPPHVDRSPRISATATTAQIGWSVATPIYSSTFRAVATTTTADDHRHAFFPFSEARVPTPRLPRSSARSAPVSTGAPPRSNTPTIHKELYYLLNGIPVPPPPPPTTTTDLAS